MKLQKSSCQGRVFLPRVYLCGATGSRTRDPLTVKFKSLAAKVKSSCQGFTLAGRTFSQGDEGSNLLPAKVSRENFSSYQGAKVLSAKVPGRFPCRVAVCTARQDCLGLWQGGRKILRATGKSRPNTIIQEFYNAGKESIKEFRKFRFCDPSQEARYNIPRYDVRGTADEGRVKLPRVVFDRNGVMVPLFVACTFYTAFVAPWPERLHLPQHGAVYSVGGEALLLRQQLEALLIDECRVRCEREESRPLTVPG